MDLRADQLLTEAEAHQRGLELVNGECHRAETYCLLADDFVRNVKCLASGSS